MADTSADVTVTATGYVVGAPGGLILTYLDANTTGISWIKGVYADKTMVRGAVGRLPTSRTDGYLVYYGTGVSANDTGVSFEETAAPIYYRAWSQNAGGVWEEGGISGFIEGGQVTYIALFFIVLVLSGFVIWGRNPNMIVAIMSAGMWAVLLWYNIQNPITGMATGSTGSQMLVMIFGVGIIAMPLITVMRMNNNKREYKQYQYDQKIKRGDLSEVETITRGRSNDIEDMSASEYKQYLHGKLHARRR